MNARVSRTKILSISVVDRKGIHVKGATDVLTTLSGLGEERAATRARSTPSLFVAYVSGERIDSAM